MKYEIKATAYHGLLGVEVIRVSRYDFEEEARTIITRQVVDTYNQSVRDALVKLGWTPPTPGFIEGTV